jgi:hypothetical protein
MGPPSYSTNVVTERPEVTSEVGRKVSTQKIAFAHKQLYVV